MLASQPGTTFNENNETHDAAFWRDRLEVGYEDVLELHARGDFLVSWITALGPRYRALLLVHLGLSPELSAKDARDAILERRSELLLPVLVDAATSRKRTVALLDIARGALDKEELARCASPAGEMDRRALAWMLYLQDRANLELVFHRDRVERYGFERRVLREPISLPNGLTLAAFLTVANVQALLDRYETEARTDRKSACAAVLRIGDRHVIFVKREQSRTFLSKGIVNTFGFRREWIVLDFAADLARVRVASTSSAAPLALADAIAGAALGVAVDYIPEIVPTPADAVDTFLAKATRDPAQLTLVEIAVRRAPLAGAPNVTIGLPDDESVTDAARQLSLWSGTTFATARNLASLKLRMFEKRIRLTLSPHGADHVVVRYADHMLSSRERELFEENMRVAHGIHVLPREVVRHAA